MMNFNTNRYEVSESLSGKLFIRNISHDGMNLTQLKALLKKAGNSDNIILETIEKVKEMVLSGSTIPVIVESEKHHG